MTDMTAFEQQVAGEMVGRAGPVRPVDDLAIFDAVTAASRSQRWGFTMFSALKFIAASVIVALFGGFLLSGVLTSQRGDEVVPAAVIASPSPAAVTSSPTPEATSEVTPTTVRTDILPGVALTVEEVEQRVYRVINDGVRDLTLPVTHFDGPTWIWMTTEVVWGLTVGRDGSVWLWQPVFPSEHQIVPSDHPPVFALGEDPPPRLDRAIEFVTEDGAIFDVGQAVRRFDPDAASGWRVLMKPARSAVIDPAGGIWVHGSSLDERKPSGAFLTRQLAYSSDGADWTQFEVPFEGRANGLWISDAGEVWLRDEDRHIWRFDGETWHRQVLRQSAEVDVGPGGVLWAWDSDLSGGSFEPYEMTMMTFGRYDGAEWLEFDVSGYWSDLLPAWAAPMPPFFQVAPDGSVWINPVRRLTPEREQQYENYACEGLHRFDGAAWTAYLEDVCVDGMDIGPDGAVWLRGYPRDGHTHVYVIPPEAVAATE